MARKRIDNLLDYLKEVNASVVCGSLGLIERSAKTQSICREIEKELGIGKKTDK